VVQIVKLGGTMNIRIAPTYHYLRMLELDLTADYLVKVAEEKERQKEERARLREEEAAQREFAAERARLEKERQHYLSGIERLRASGNDAGAQDLAEKLAKVDGDIASNEQRAANARAGHVYVISNIGASGSGVVKIGLTRRQRPEDRVDELGDASVPFDFDIHALVFSADAVALETKLHQHFADRKVNLVNGRREFFYVTPAEVKEALRRFDASLLEFTDEPEAVEWRQSENARRAAGPAGPAGLGPAGPA
jgi:hypothetical protein